MPRVAVRCPNPDCGKIYRVDEGSLGRRGRCKKCDTSFLLAATDASDEAAPPLTPEWTEGQVLLTDFVVQGKLGQGGMGSVYLVQSKTTGQRFAVKKALVANAISRRNFLTELITWMDLPEHPYLAACRFFRSIGDEIAIFADYIEGGTLADWIRRGKLTRLDQMLDVAIQFAWGLHIAHECGVVHRDVKPGNVLMTADGQVKISDFGLAKAKVLAGEQLGVAGETMLVSVGGKTRQYCSPEQAAGEQVSRKTDIWSYAVSLLDMFIGKVPSCVETGEAAPDVLQEFLDSGPVDGLTEMIPAELSTILEKCLKETPSERWTNMSAVAEAIQEVYRKVNGKRYPRNIAKNAAIGAPIKTDPPSDGALRWDNPRTWLVKALQFEGRPASDADKLIPARPRSSQAQAAADLAVFDEAQRKYEQLVAAGRNDLELDKIRGT